MKKYIEPRIKVVVMTTKENSMTTVSFKDDWADAKEFKDDDLWNEEVSSETQKKADLWNKEW